MKVRTERDCGRSTVFWYFWLKRFEDVQVGFMCFSLRHVAMVRTDPVEGRTFQHFNSSCIQTSIG